MISISQDISNPSLYYIDGELTGDTCLEFKKQTQEILADKHQPTIFDCSNLIAIDGCGLGIITELYMAKKTFTLYHLRGQPNQLLKTLGIKQMLTRHTTTTHSLQPTTQ